MSMEHCCNISDGVERNFCGPFCVLHISYRTGLGFCNKPPEPCHGQASGNVRYFRYQKALRVQ